MYAEAFPRLARSSARVMGSPSAFGVALLIVILWAVVGPLFQFSNGWQLTINTGTTIVTISNFLGPSCDLGVHAVRRP